MGSATNSELYDFYAPFTKQKTLAPLAHYMSKTWRMGGGGGGGARIARSTVIQEAVP